MTHPKYEMANWIESGIRPNVYAVVTLRQGLVVNDGPTDLWTKGSPQRYEQVARSFLHNLDLRILKNAARRFGKQLPVATTLEGDGQTIRYHLNFLIHKPDWMSFEKFEEIFRSEWQKIPWSLPVLEIAERTGNCVSYSLKEGPESLLAGATRF